MVAAGRGNLLHGVPDPNLETRPRSGLQCVSNTAAHSSAFHQTRQENENQHYLFPPPPPPRRIATVQQTNQSPFTIPWQTPTPQSSRDGSQSSLTPKKVNIANSNLIARKYLSHNDSPCPTPPPPPIPPRKFWKKTPEKTSSASSDSSLLTSRRLSENYLREQYSPTYHKKKLWEKSNSLEVVQEEIPNSLQSKVLTKDSHSYLVNKLTNLRNLNPIKSRVTDIPEIRIEPPKRVQFLETSNNNQEPRRSSSPKERVSKFFKKFKGVDTIEENTKVLSAKVDSLDLLKPTLKGTKKLQDENVQQSQSTFEDIKKSFRKFSQSALTFGKVARDEKTQKGGQEYLLSPDKYNQNNTLRPGDLRESSPSIERRRKSSVYSTKPAHLINSPYVRSQVNKLAGQKRESIVDRSQENESKLVTRSITDYFRDNAKEKFSPPPPDLITGGKRTLQASNSPRSSLTRSGDNMSVGRNPFVRVLSTLCGGGLKIKERMIIGFCVAVVLFTMLLVIDLQMDLGISGRKYVPSHGKVKFGRDEDGPGSAYNSFRKRFLQKTHSASSNNVSKESPPGELTRPNFDKVKMKYPGMGVSSTTKKPKIHDDFSDLLDYTMLGSIEREKHRIEVDRYHAVIQKSQEGDLIQVGNPKIAELLNVEVRYVMQILM
ncbi:hypothetical protein Trydic_g14010 [Trypoxylus dichotomus]